MVAAATLAVCSSSRLGRPPDLWIVQAKTSGNIEHTAPKASVRGAVMRKAIEDSRNGRSTYRQEADDMTRVSASSVTLSGKLSGSGRL